MSSQLLARARSNRLTAIRELLEDQDGNIFELEQARQQKTAAGSRISFTTIRKPGSARPLVLRPRAA